MVHSAASEKVINNSARAAECNLHLELAKKSLKICKFVGLLCDAIFSLFIGVKKILKKR